MHRAALLADDRPREPQVPRDLGGPGNIRPDASTTAMPLSRNAATAAETRGVGVWSWP
ncbi:MAG: hypothetical protein M5U18_01800 [Dehalococcoidia bacterium]|nr:hypothetical protein [Dehalococcoidia bacterium]